MKKDEKIEINLAFEEKRCPRINDCCGSCLLATDEGCTLDEVLGGVPE